MINISDFGSVLEIVFAINAIFYIFEISPLCESRITKQLKKYYELRDKKFKITNNTEAFPIGFVISMTYPLYKRVVGLISIIVSLSSLALLIYTGYYPDTMMSSGWWALYLSLSISLVPISSLLTYSITARFIREASGQLEEAIHKHEKR